MNEKYRKYKYTILKYNLEHRKQIDKYRKKWYNKNKKRILLYNKNLKNLIRFNGMREIVLKRDKMKCLICDMTNNQHLKTFGQSLLVNHIDGSGINSIKKNNLLENLETLCCICHSKKDRARVLIQKGGVI